MQLREVSTLNIVANHVTTLRNEIKRIEEQEKKLKQVLKGEYKNDDNNKEKALKAFFPLISKEVEEGFYGILESVTIHISKAAADDKFIIVPSEKEIEKNVLDQCKRSWKIALVLARKYVKKPYQNHEVIISFDKRDGFYEGSSLGITLTISFLEELLKFYNPTYVINIEEQIAFTGGINEDQKILPIGEEIIKQKVSAVFFSQMNSFVIPKLEEAAAQTQLTELRKHYPNRKLKLISVEDIADVMNRRDVVDIRKQKLIVRTGKFVKKNWVSAVVTVLLAVLFGYLFVMDWDDNPAIITTDGTTVFIKNKNEKMLWSQKYTVPNEIINSPRVLNNYIRIVDINGDGKNEVLFCLVNPENVFENVEYGSIVCFDYTHKLLWKYACKDTVFSERETIPPPYRIEMIDTISFNGQIQLLVFANSILSFASAIFKIDLQKGMRIGDTFWSSGNTNNAFLKDINNDGNDDIVQWGHDNGFGDVVLCCIELDRITGYRPSTDEYNVLGLPLANLIGYIRFPKNDYELLAPRRVALLDKESLNQTKTEDEIVFTINTLEFPFKATEHIAGVFYKVNNNLKDIDVFIHDPFRIARDSLVSHGVLKPPYTETKEYINIIKSKILYYKDGKWVKREELE